MTRKSQNNNVVNKLNNVANNINNNVRTVFQNEMLINTIRVLIIIYIAFGIPMMNNKHLNVVNDNIVRLVIVALIVYLAFMDIVTAVLLTIAFIVTLHHAKNSSDNNDRIKQVNDVAALVEKVNNMVSNKEGYENNLENESENNQEKKNNNSNLNTINDSSNVLQQNASEVNGYDSDEEYANAGANFNGQASAMNQANTEAVNNGNKINSAPMPSTNNLANNNANINANNNANNNSNNSNNSANNNSNNISNNNANNGNEVLDVNNIPQANNNEKELSVFDEINNASINDKKNNNKNVDIITQMNNNQPSSETLTDSILRAQGAQMDVNAPVGLTTAANLYDISENAVPGADIMNQVKTIQEQHGAQGMDYPHGTGAKRYDGFHFDQDNHPNLKHEMLRNERFD